MRAGELKDRIIVQTPSYTIDEYGAEHISEYTDKYSVRAEVRYKEGNLVNDLGEITNSYSVIFITRIHYTPDEKDIISYKDKKYRILSIVPNREKQLNEIKTALINE